MLKKVLAWLTLLILFAPLWVNFTILYFEKQAIRKEVKEKLLLGTNPSDLQVFRFTKEQELALDWDHASEFKYQRQSYDVVRRVESGDSVTLYCWWDAAESAVNQKLEALVAEAIGKAPVHEERSQSLIKAIKIPYNLSMFEWYPARIFSWQSAQTRYLKLFYSRSHEPAAPPPRT